MRYIPHTPEEIREMLAEIGPESVSRLFDPIPDALQLKRPLDLPEPLPECRLRTELEKLAATNRAPAETASFAGAGIYNHYVPAAVPQMLLRSEFYTAYTPYQPEVSQGTLQSIFEYQTMMARLLGMELSNASLYDGSTAVAEAVSMAIRITRGKRPRVVLAGALHPEHVAVTRTALQSPDETLVSVPAGADGRVDIAALKGRLGSDIAAVVVQSPNVFGLVEDLATLRRLTQEHGILLIVSFTEALAYGLLKPPGEFGADIVVGEGQSFGMPMSYGGPLLGIMATRKKYVRSMPGRLVGKTEDRHGNDCFVITLSTREQHIRRAKATSNICTNQGLCALGAAIYLSLLGNTGLHRLATLNHHAARHLAARLETIDGVTLPYGQTSWFNEFVIQTSHPAADLVDHLATQGVVPGVALSRLFPDRADQLLVTVTEMNPHAEMDRFVSLLRDYLAG